MTEFETILLERKGGADGKGGVGWITLNRPKALNALNAQVLDDVIAALDELDGDDSIGAVVITGSAKAFAAGADIKEMAPKSYMDMFLADYFARWDRHECWRFSCWYSRTRSSGQRGWCCCLRWTIGRCSCGLLCGEWWW